MSERQEMEDIVRNLEHFFKRVDVEPSEDDGDDNNSGEMWELKDPVAQEFWTLVHSPHTDNLVFGHKFKNADDVYNLTHSERVKDVEHESSDFVRVHCETKDALPYRFTLRIDNTISPFNLTECLISLRNSPFESLVKDVENEIDELKWSSKEGRPLKARSISANIRRIIGSMSNIAAVEKQKTTMMRPLEVSARTESINPSQASSGMRTPGRRTTLQNPQSSQSKRPRGSQVQATSTKKKSRAPSTSAPEASIASGLTDVPAELTPGEDIDYSDAQKNFEKFWTECQDCFVWDTDTKYEIEISRMENAPTDWTIRAFEQKGMETTRHFLINMPSSVNKQTLCVMPMIETRPTSWDEIRNGRFYIINGQHSVAASKSMVEMGVSEQILKNFRTWNYFIVWSQDKSKLRRLSAYYNRVNHFSVFKPTWSTNVLKARYIWTNLGRPTPPRTGAAVQRANKRTTRDVSNDAKYKDFVQAIQQRFALIDVSKNLAAAKKATSRKGSKGDVKLDLHNKIKIITASEEIFKLWSELISTCAQGDLVDVDSYPLRKFKDNPKWQPQKDGVLNREFFKWLGNMTEEDHGAMIRHLLNKSGPSRDFKYPKVVLKLPTTVVMSCYSVKEWIERRKRKQLVRAELNKIKPSLGLFDADGDFIAERWKKFKMDYNVTSATMRVLLDAPGDEFFNGAKLTRNKNKSCEELSPYAKEFFKTFLRRRNEFQAPTGKAFFQRHDGARNEFGGWPDNAWPEAGSKIKLGVIDFRLVPGHIDREKSSVKKPYFEDFMNLFCSGTLPKVTDLPVWMCITGDCEADAQVTAFIEGDLFCNEYTRVRAVYVPGKFERLGDFAASHRLSKENVNITFMLKKSHSNLPKPPRSFPAPETSAFMKPRKYDELEYRLFPTELRMEFYFQVLDLYCKPGDAVFTMFTGTKIVSAAVMNSLNALCISDVVDAQFFEDVARDALTLDKTDFMSNGYPVDSSKHPRVAVKPPARGKQNDADIEDEEEFIDDRDEEDLEAVEEEDLPLDDSLEDGVDIYDPLPIASGSGFRSTPSTAINLASDVDPFVHEVIPSSPRALFQESLDDDIEVMEQPISASALGAGTSRPAAKRRRPNARVVVGSSRGRGVGLESSLESVLQSISLQQMTFSETLRKQAEIIAEQQEKMARDRMEMQADMLKFQREMFEMNKSNVENIPRIVADTLRSIVPAINAPPISRREPQRLLLNTPSSGGQQDLLSDHPGLVAAQSSEIGREGPSSQVIADDEPTPMEGIQKDGPASSSDLSFGAGARIDANEDDAVKSHQFITECDRSVMAELPADSPLVCSVEDCAVVCRIVDNASIAQQGEEVHSLDNIETSCRPVLTLQPCVEIYKGMLCTASVDSLLNPEDCGLSIPSMRNLLCSAATAQSTMDYSSARIDDGVVDSRSLCSWFPVGVRSSSPMKPVCGLGSIDSSDEIGGVVPRALYKTSFKSHDSQPQRLEPLSPHVGS